MEQRGKHRPQKRRLTARSVQSGIVLALVCAVVGWLFEVNVQANGSSRVSEDTAGLLRGRESEVAHLQKDVDTLSTEIDTLRKSLGDTSSKPVKSEEDQRSVLPALNGPAITVTLSDSPLWKNAQSGDDTIGDQNVNDYVVHQQDLEAVINALWAGGAEAMTIQGVRVQQSTAVRCVGNVLLLQGKQYAPPYVIRAIGPQAQMQAALYNSTAVKIYLEYVASIGLGWKVSLDEQLNFPKTSAATQELKYASVLPQKDAVESISGANVGSEENMAGSGESTSDGTNGSASSNSTAGQADNHSSSNEKN